MRLGFLLLILIATLFGSGFWYNQFDTVCRTPIRYHIGAIDDRFGTSPEEIRRIASRAESVWESSLQEELFIYDDSSDFAINLIFDDRQQNAEIEAELKEDLDAKVGMNEQVSAQYEKLIGEFRNLKKQYEKKVVSYESSLATYNEEVMGWNERGGAPDTVLKELKTREQILTEEQSALETLAKKLNGIIAELNRIGAQGNSLITDYNTIVREYNEHAHSLHEFAQGEYTGDAINVYQFDSEEELTVVIAHEFGHALSLGHVDNPESVLFATMEHQSTARGLSQEDIAEFRRVCSEKSLLHVLIATFGSFF